MLLILNLGLKSIRAIVFDERGRRLATSGQPVNSRLYADRVEQDAVEWKTKLLQVCREALDSLVSIDGIRAISVSCSASCLVPVDQNCEPVGRVIMVSDKRAKAEGAEIGRLPEFVSLADKYAYSATAYSQLARIRWLPANEPEQHSKTFKYLSPNDFLICLLTGRYVTDTLNAEKLFLDQETGNYPFDLLAKLDIEPDVLPEVVGIGTNVGKVDTAFAAELGLRNRPDVVVGTYDAVCSVFGTGCAAPGQICDVSGTVTSVRMYSDQPYLDPQKRVMSQYFPPSDGYLIGGSNNLGGGLIEWAKKCFYQGNDNPYDLMNSEAAGSGEQGEYHTGIVFLPHLLGERAPGWNPDSRGVFFGLDRGHDRSQLMRSIFESIGYSIRDFLECFRDAPVEPTLITASGGLAKITIANEIKATITGIPYHYMDEFESTSLGAAIIILCAQDVYPDYRSACENIVAARQIFLPRAHDAAYYEDMYGLYRDLTAAVNPLFAKRNEILSCHSGQVAEYVENL